MKQLSICFLVLLLGGCVSGYAEFYRPTAGQTPELIAEHRISPPPAVPLLDRSGDDPKTILQAYARAGYRPIGFASFNSGQRQWESGALDQGKKVGADVVVVVNPQYTGSQSTVIPITTPTSQTSYIQTEYGSATATTYGSETTYIPITINRYNFGAIFFVKMKVILGVNWRELSDSERQQLQSNKGFFVVSLVNDSPAFNADVLPGDIVVEVDGQSAGNLEGYTALLTAHKGETVELTIVRNGQKIKKSIALGM